MICLPEQQVQIKNNFTEMYLMMPSTTIALMVCYTKKGVGRGINKNYLQMKSPESLVQNQNDFTEMVLMLLSTKIDQKVSLACWLPELQ